jgi:hypothetical protein
MAVSFYGVRRTGASPERSFLRNPPRRVCRFTKVRSPTDDGRLTTCEAKPTDEAKRSKAPQAGSQVVFRRWSFVFLSPKGFLVLRKKRRVSQSFPFDVHVVHRTSAGRAHLARIHFRLTASPAACSLVVRGGTPLGKPKNRGKRPGTNHVVVAGRHFEVRTVTIKSKKQSGNAAASIASFTVGEGAFSNECNKDWLYGLQMVNDEVGNVTLSAWHKCCASLKQT